MGADLKNVVEFREGSTEISKDVFSYSPNKVFKTYGFEDSDKRHKLINELHKNGKKILKGFLNPYLKDGETSEYANIGNMVQNYVLAYNIVKNKGKEPKDWTITTAEEIGLSDVRGKVDIIEELLTEEYSLNYIKILKIINILEKNGIIFPKGGAYSETLGKMGFLMEFLKENPNIIKDGELIEDFKKKL